MPRRKKKSSTTQYSLDFDLYYGDDQQHENIIYRAGGDDSEVATVEITSTSSISWNQPSNSSPSADNCHFYNAVLNDGKASNSLTCSISYPTSESSTDIKQDSSDSSSSSSSQSSLKLSKDSEFIL